MVLIHRRDRFENKIKREHAYSINPPGEEYKSYFVSKCYIKCIKYRFELNYTIYIPLNRWGCLWSFSSTRKRRLFLACYAKMQKKRFFNENRRNGDKMVRRRRNRNQLCLICLVSRNTFVGVRCMSVVCGRCLFNCNTPSFKLQIFLAISHFWVGHGVNQVQLNVAQITL